MNLKCCVCGSQDIIGLIDTRSDTSLQEYLGAFAGHFGICQDCLRKIHSEKIRRIQIMGNENKPEPTRKLFGKAG